VNAVNEVLRHFRAQPGKLALWTPGQGEVSFGELGALVAAAQAELTRSSVGPGDCVLLMDFPGPGLFSALLAILGLGATCILVEPWMPVREIDHVLRIKRPKVFVANAFGRIWGLRVAAVREIPLWIPAHRLRRAAAPPGGALAVRAEEVDPTTAGMIAFSSGTSGKPKGIVRTHGYLLDAREILTEGGKRDPFAEPDLAVFPGIALFHITTGRGALLVPGSWKPRALRQLADAARVYRPATLSCGPGFMKTLFDFPGFESLRSIYVGGALTDCWIFDRVFERWPEAAVTHIYGSTEAEPVSHGDARSAVRRSRERGYFQTLELGAPISGIRYRLEQEGAWISGPNVCPEYIGAPEETRLVKRRDPDGTLWHFLGDRLELEDGKFWFRGRAFQRPEDFELEQRIVAFLGTSALFVVATAEGAYCFGQGVRARETELRSRFPSLAGVRETRIVRDRRHRARIDRARSLPRGWDRAGAVGGAGKSEITEQ
jgi:acyl-CoA synthetase (AMP-forming)/AMP-acid ligase II